MNSKWRRVGALRYSFASAIFLALVMIAYAGCSDPGVTTPPSDPTTSLRNCDAQGNCADSTTTQLSPGGTARVVLRLSDISSSGVVTWSVEESPNRLPSTLHIAHSSASPVAVTDTVTVTADANATLGTTVTIMVTATRSDFASTRKHPLRIEIVRPAAYDLQLSTQELRVSPGSSGALAATVVRNAGFNEPITFSTSSPKLLTGFIENLPGSGYYEITIRVPLDYHPVEGRPDVVTIEIVAQGYARVIGTILVTVPDFSIRSPADGVGGSLLLIQGEAPQSIPIEIQRVNGFTDPLEMYVGTIPVGVQVEIKGSPIVGHSGSLQLSADFTAVPGYPQIRLTVHSGSLVRFVTLHFTIERPGAQRTWRNVGTIEGCQELHFPTPTVGYIVIKTGTVLKSTDAGRRWDTSHRWPNVMLTSVHFLDASNGFVSGESTTGLGLGVIYKTTNGGASWRTVSEGVLAPILRIRFSEDKSVGLAASFDGMIARSIDGGQSWSSQHVGFDGTYFGGVIFRPGTTNAIAHGTEVWRTTNGGATWFLDPNSSQRGGSFRDHVYIPGTKSLFGVLGRGFVARSDDDGATWKSIPLPEEGLTSLPAIAIDPSGRTVAIGSDLGAIIRSTDGGETWSVDVTIEEFITQVVDIAALNTTEMVVIGANGIWRRE